MRRFNVTYIEVLRNGKTISCYFQSVKSQNEDYGSTSQDIKESMFHKVIEDLVLPKVISLQGNKVTKVSSTLIDEYDCYYSTSSDSDEIYVCFTKIDTPKILPIRLLSDLKQDEYAKNDSNIELRVHIGTILDKFHDELLSYKKSDNNDGTNAGDETEDDIQDVIQIMNDNIDKFLQRQERVSLLVDKTSKLNSTSYSFKRKATKINDRLWWQRMKNTTLLIFAVILITSALFIFYYVL